MHTCSWIYAVALRHSQRCRQRSVCTPNCAFILGEPGCAQVCCSPNASMGIECGESWTDRLKYTLGNSTLVGRADVDKRFDMSFCEYGHGTYAEAAKTVLSIYIQSSRDRTPYLLGILPFPKPDYQHLVREDEVAFPCSCARCAFSGLYSIRMCDPLRPALGSRG